MGSLFLNPALSAGPLASMIKIQGIALTLLVACAIAADPCDSTAPPEPGPAPSTTPAPPNPCDTTPSPAPAPTPAPTPGCDDKPADWKSTAGSTCADYVSKAWCTSAAAMAVVGTKAWTALSTIGLSTGSRPLLLAVVVVAAPQLLADRHVRDTHMTRPLANQWDVAAGTFSSAAEQMMRLPWLLRALLWARARRRPDRARQAAGKQRKGC